MIDFIFKNWQKKLSDFESSVKKDLAEIRKCKAEIQADEAGYGIRKAERPLYPR